jgi:hypothetical protein
MHRLAAEFIHRSRLDINADVSNDHELDALISAVVARLARLGGTQPIPVDLLDLARVEGWIHIPRGMLGRLASDGEHPE